MDTTNVVIVIVIVIVIERHLFHNIMFGNKNNKPLLTSYGRFDRSCRSISPT